MPSFRLPRLRPGLTSLALSATLLHSLSTLPVVTDAAIQPQNYRQFCHGGGYNLNCRQTTPDVQYDDQPIPFLTGQGDVTSTVGIVSDDGVLTVQALYAANYAVEAVGLYINDNSTGIPDIAAIHNAKVFNVVAQLVWDEEVFVVNSTNLLLWTMSVDGTQFANGTIDLSESRSLPTEIQAGSAVVTVSGTHQVAVKIMLDDIQSETDRDYQSFNKGASFVPLIMVLLFAMTTHMVELSLGIGIFVGACMVSGSLTEGFRSTLDTYILEAVASIDHGFVYLFVLFMAGMVGILEKSGGLIGLTHALQRIVAGPRSAQWCSFLCGIIIFFDDYANTLVAGSSMRPLMDAFCVSREKLAFIVDATAAPIASIVPISSWVGFEVSLIQAELDKILAMDDDPEIVTTGFGVFLETIKYRYYCIFMLFLMPLLILSRRDMGPMLIAERRTQVYGRKDGGPGASTDASGEKLTSHNAPEEDTPPRWWNMALPIVMLIIYIFYLLVWTGDDGSGTQSFVDIMQNSDSYAALLWGTMAGALTAYAFYLFQDKKDGNIIWFNLKGKWHCIQRWWGRMRGRCRRRRDGEEEEVDDEVHATWLMSYDTAMTSFLTGMEHIFGALVVLTLAWASGHIMVSVGLDRFFGELIVESNLDYRMLPTLSFIIAILIAFATGTSWGTMTIMFPLMLVPAYNASDGDPNIFYGTTAGILAGAVAGDHASPISDTTVLSSMASECKILEHVRTQAPYVLVVVTWSILVGTIPSGREAFSNGISIFLGFLFMLLHVIFTSAYVINRSGRYDPFTELYLCCKKDEELVALKVDTKRAHELGRPLNQPPQGKVLEDDDDDDGELRENNDKLASNDPSEVIKPEKAPDQSDHEEFNNETSRTTQRGDIDETQKGDKEGGDGDAEAGVEKAVEEGEKKLENEEEGGGGGEEPPAAEEEGEKKKKRFNPVKAGFGEVGYFIKELR